MATLALHDLDQSVGILSLGGNAVIVFGLDSANSLSFSDSSAISWSAFTLTLENFDFGSDSLRFGTASGGLTLAQLANIDLNGLGLDANGCLVAVPEPAGLILAAGLEFSGGSPDAPGKGLTFSDGRQGKSLLETAFPESVRGAGRNRSAGSQSRSAPGRSD